MKYAFENKLLMYSMVFDNKYLQLLAVKRFLLHYERHFHRRALIKKFEYGQRGITKQKFKNLLYTRRKKSNKHPFARDRFKSRVNKLENRTYSEKQALDKDSENTCYFTLSIKNYLYVASHHSVVWYMIDVILIS